MLNSKTADIHVINKSIEQSFVNVISKLKKTKSVQSSCINNLNILDNKWKEKFITLFWNGVEVQKLIRLSENIVDLGLENSGAEYASGINEHTLKHNYHKKVEPFEKVRRDKIFKKVFGSKRLFLSFLKAFVTHPSVEKLELQHIEQCSTEYINLFFPDRISDIVYKINIDGEEFHFVVLLEHQSTVHHSMSFRILEYMVLQWREYINSLEDGEYKNKEFKFFPIIPIVFYDGLGSWTAETKFKNKVKNYEEFSKFVPDFEYNVVSLSEISKEKLLELGDPMSFILMLDKARASDDIIDFFAKNSSYIEKVMAVLKNSEDFGIVNDCLVAFLNRYEIKKETQIELINEFNEGRYQGMFEYCGSAVREERKEWLKKEQEWTQEKQEWTQEKEKLRKIIYKTLVPSLQLKLRLSAEDVKVIINNASLDALDSISDNIGEISTIDDLYETMKKTPK